MTAITFDEFYDEHYRRVVVSLRLAVGNLDEAEDAAQDAFAKAMLRWRRVSVMTRPATWVYVVAVRELRRRDRMHGRRAATAELPRLARAPDHADSIASTEAFERALAGLSPRQRLAVALRFQADLTVPEVSRAMRCSEGTVKSTLHTALGHLRVDLASEDLEGTHDGR